MTEKHNSPVNRASCQITNSNWDSLLNCGDNETLSRALLEGLLHHKNNASASDHTSRYELHQFVKNFLLVFCHEMFRVPSCDSHKYVTLNGIIAYLVACTEHINTDKWLRVLDAENAPLEKILALYSIRNRYHPDIQRLFLADPQLASQWHAMQMYAIEPPAQRWIMDNARALYASMPDSYKVVSPGSVAAGYFAVTYVDPENEPQYKKKLNTAIQRVSQSIQWSGYRNSQSIAIITDRWFPDSAVYRALYPYVRRLSECYKLTLVHLGKMNPSIDTSLFSSVRVFPRLRNVWQLSDEQKSAVLNQDWKVAFFPDIGMSTESIYLGNCRLAPIQVMGYGHPASMHGGQIDYFIAGQESELPQLAEQHFSERLILLPGIGMIPVWPTVAIDLQKCHESNRVLINCPWTCMKINADMIDLLRNIIDECKVPIYFRFFTDLTDELAYQVCQRDLEELLGKDNVEIHRLLPYREFLSEMAKSQLTLIPYPFGGYNTVIDSLYVDLPVVTREGVRGYNRFPAAILRRAGLGDLVARGSRDFKEKIINLIEDPDYRSELRMLIGRTDLEQKLTANDDEYAFRRAIDHIIVNHDSLQASQIRAPIKVN